MSFDTEFKELCEKYDIHFEIVPERMKVVFHPFKGSPDARVTLVEDPDSDFMEKAVDCMTNYRGDTIA